MDVLHSLTLSMHTLYSKVRAPAAPRGNQPPDQGGGPLPSRGRDRQTGPDQGGLGPRPEPSPHQPPSTSGEGAMYKRGVHMAQTSSPTRAAPGRSSPDPPTSSDPDPMSLPPPVSPNMNLAQGHPQQGHRYRTHVPEPKRHESPPHRGTPPQVNSIAERPMRSYPPSASSTYSPALSTPAAPSSPTTQCAATARQGPRATPPPPTGATGQTPPSTAPTTGPPTPQHDGTDSPT
ncbi:hypothetical protein CRENBAI_016102 [Crenichthys baileyi]|uniref:Uncharacterized protein n=1 Tax=Crenichthys baileyi TaxID=28760 RepID=A0AAV9RDB0_9TELE